MTLVQVGFSINKTCYILRKVGHEIPPMADTLTHPCSRTNNNYHSSILIAHFTNFPRPPFTIITAWICSAICDHFHEKSPQIDSFQITGWKMKVLTSLKNTENHYGSFLADVAPLTTSTCSVSVNSPPVWRPHLAWRHSILHLGLSTAQVSW